MSAQLLITAVGPDRAGLVDELSEELANRRLNIETSRMARLGGEFAMLLLVAGPSAEISRLAVDPGVLAGGSGLQLQARETSSDSRKTAAVPFAIRGAGMDHPGIVHEIAALLHRFGVGIDAMDTEVGCAPNSGTPIFGMEAVVSVPDKVRIKELREALLELADELNMDIDFSPL
jgi:glycine cleavage system transcriptional repressor